MPILAIETATLVSSVAIGTEDTLLAEITLQTKQTHSEILMPHIGKILEMAAVNKKDLKAIAVSIGPGSFTGLRIGLATAKALAYAMKIPLLAVPSLEALAYGCPVPGSMLAPMLDAQKGNVYMAVFAWQADGTLQEVMPVAVMEIHEALATLQKYPIPVLVMGEAAVLHSEKIQQAGGNLALAAPHVIIQRAGSVAALGQMLLKKGITEDIMGLEPLYIRRSEAEVLWERRQGVVV
jgi:tRNA threonylcarbamoyladenosine biosynthesis protein TsaB